MRLCIHQQLQLLRARSRFQRNKHQYVAAIKTAGSIDVRGLKKPRSKSSSSSQGQSQNDDDVAKRTITAAVPLTVLQQTDLVTRPTTPEQYGRQKSAEELFWIEYMSQVHAADRFKVFLNLAYDTWCTNEGKPHSLTDAFIPKELEALSSVEPEAGTHSGNSNYQPGMGTKDRGQGASSSAAPAFASHVHPALSPQPHAPVANGVSAPMKRPQPASQAATSTPGVPSIDQQDRLWSNVDRQLRAKAVAAVDTLELLGLWLSTMDTSSQQRPTYKEHFVTLGTDFEATVLLSDNAASAQDIGDEEQQVEGYRVNPGKRRPLLGNMSLAVQQKCQDLVQVVLAQLVPLLQISALRPKHLASLARAINTLAAASPATNRRQITVTGKTGYLELQAPASTTKSLSAPHAQDVSRDADGDVRQTTDTDGNMKRTNIKSRKSNAKLKQHKPQDVVDAPALDAQPAPTSPPQGPQFILPSLPRGLPAVYADAVQAALPHASPAAYCYLLRALSLDRAKRLLRAAKMLQPCLTSRAVELAPVLDVHQLAVVISCGAQLVWNNQGPWLQAALSRVRVVLQQSDGGVPAAAAAAMLHALGRLSTPPSQDVSLMLFRSLAAGLNGVIPSNNTSADKNTDGAEGGHDFEQLRQRLTSGNNKTGKIRNTDVVEGLSSLQLCSVLWAAANLGISPPEPWLVAAMKHSYLLMKADSFSASQLANTMWALSKMQWWPAPIWMATYVSLLEEALPRMTPGEVAMVAWALGNIRERNRPGDGSLRVVNSYIAAAAVSRCDTLTAQQLSLIWVSWARTNYRPEADVVKALLARLNHLLASKFGPAPETALIDGYEGHMPIQAVVGEQKQHDGAVSHTAQDKTQIRQPETETKQLKNASGLQASGGGPLLMGHAAIDVTLTSQSVANICWALNFLGVMVFHPSTAALLLHASRQLLHKFTMVELGQVGTALGETASQGRQLNMEALEAQAKAAQDKQAEQQHDTSSNPRQTRARRKQSPAGTSSPSTSGPAVPPPPPQAYQPPVAVRPSLNIDDDLLNAFYDTVTQHLHAYNNQRHQQWRKQQQQQQSDDTSTGGGDGQDSRSPSSEADPAMAVDHVMRSSSSGNSGRINFNRSFVPSSAQMGNLLLAAVKLGDRRQPPAELMGAFYRATQPSLLSWRITELEVLMQPLFLMQPPPTPPLAWIKAYSDRRDTLMSSGDLPKHLRKQMLLVLRIMQDAWRAKLNNMTANGNEYDMMAQNTRAARDVGRFNQESGRERKVKRRGSRQADVSRSGQHEEGARENVSEYAHDVSLGGDPQAARTGNNGTICNVDAGLSSLDTSGTQSGADYHESRQARQDQQHGQQEGEDDEEALQADEIQKLRMLAELQHRQRPVSRSPPKRKANVAVDRRGVAGSRVRGYMRSDG